MLWPHAREEGGGHGSIAPPRFFVPAALWAELDGVGVGVGAHTRPTASLQLPLLDPAHCHAKACGHVACRHDMDAHPAPHAPPDMLPAGTSPST